MRLEFQIQREASYRQEKPIYGLNPPRAVSDYPMMTQLG